MKFVDRLVTALAWRQPVVIILTLRDYGHLQDATSINLWSFTHNGTFFRGVPIVRSGETVDSPVVALDHSDPRLLVLQTI